MRLKFSEFVGAFARIIAMRQNSKKRNTCEIFGFGNYDPGKLWLSKLSQVFRFLEFCLIAITGAKAPTNSLNFSPIGHKVSIPNKGLPSKPSMIYG